MITKGYLCNHCESFFVLGRKERARKYCTRKCRDAAYYKRKVAV